MNGPAIVAASAEWRGFRSVRGIAAALAAGLGRVGRTRAVLVGDGGPGTAAALLEGRGGRVAPLRASGPDGRERLGAAIRLSGALFIESCTWVGGEASALPPPTERTSLGLGQAIRLAARFDGPLVVGLGGSLTVDGGFGLARGLGLVPVDADGREVRGDGIGALERTAALTGPPPLRDRLVQVWTDVRTPYAACTRRYGPQKGLAEHDVPRVERALEGWARVLARWRRSRGLAPLDPEIPGGGAAGGLGLTLANLLSAPLLPGARACAQATDLARRLRGADVVLTGEGRVDATTWEGKAPAEVIRVAREAGAGRVVLLAGQVAEPPPPPPTGPDWTLAAEDQPGADREARFSALLEAVADRLRSS